MFVCLTIYYKKLKKNSHVEQFHVIPNMTIVIASTTTYPIAQVLVLVLVYVYVLVLVLVFVCTKCSCAQGPKQCTPCRVPTAAQNATNFTAHLPVTMMSFKCPNQPAAAHHAHATIAPATYRSSPMLPLARRRIHDQRAIGAWIVGRIWVCHTCLPITRGRFSFVPYV